MRDADALARGPQHVGIIGDWHFATGQRIERASGTDRIALQQLVDALGSADVGNGISDVPEPVKRRSD